MTKKGPAGCRRTERRPGPEATVTAAGGEALDAATLRAVVSELRWHLRQTPDLRQAVARLIRRHEARLYGH